MKSQSVEIGTALGHTVHSVRIWNDRGLSLTMCTYGATITEALFVDRFGVSEPLTLGQSLEV